MSERFADPQAVMRRAIELAARGRGLVEPNPPVGAVIVDDDLNLVAEGFHRQFGGPHAEIAALQAAGPRAARKTLYVTLEPCCHQGKTGPCTQAIVRARLRRVVVAVQDPSPHAAGSGLQALREAGVEVELGLLVPEAARLAAPFLTLVTTGRPWVHAKWAMTLDGKIASRTGSSRWISGERAREIVHRLRGRMDAIIVGSGTVQHDDPLLTARPAGPRIATRVIVDTHAALSLDSQLVRTVNQAPVLVVAGEQAPRQNIDGLRARGVEVLTFPTGREAGIAPRLDLNACLRELGRRRMTNVFVEGGGKLLGSLFDLRLIDEAHVFLSPRLIGGAAAATPIAGTGLEQIADAAMLDPPEMETVGEDVYLHGTVRYTEGG